jgi:hypothetical protein
LGKNFCAAMGRLDARKTMAVRTRKNVRFMIEKE